MAVGGEGLLYYDKDSEREGDPNLFNALRKDIEMSGSHGSGVGPFLCETTGYNMIEKDNVCTLKLDVSFDFTLLEGYEGPLYAKVVGPGPASESVQVGLVVTEEKRIAHVAEQVHWEFLSKFKILFAAMDKNQDGYVSREELEKFIEGPETTREEIKEVLASLTREQIEQYYPVQ
jgi:hypothetical protein